MAKLFWSYLFICTSMFALAGRNSYTFLLALPSSDGAEIRTCSVTLKLSKPYSFQECQPHCTFICSCVYIC
ncbi:hypothetical protein N665_0281s0012 [Sinapis alba]|nr:hypothetical protein N665_0281s0012 [Sinapis alba]